MANLDELKSLTRYLVIESENLSDDKKLSLVKFIEEANENHLRVILSDEDYVGLEEEDILFLEQVDWGASVGGLVLALIVLKSAHYIYQNLLSRAQKACEGKVGQEKKECLRNFKIGALKAQIQALEKGKVKCKKSKDPKACVSKINEKIKKVKVKLSKI